jgi:hypothetical protein
VLHAAHRNPESDVAGATALNRNGPRYSGDIDIFHDREEAVAQAAAFAHAMPIGKEGFAFLKDGQPAQPDPADLRGYLEHAAQRRGYWPSSAEIGSAMLGRDADEFKP